MDKWIEKISCNYSKTLLIISGAVITLMMLMTTVDVFFRYCFNSPIFGVYEITEFSMVLAVFFAVGITAINNRHVNVELLITRIPKKSRWIIDCFSNFCGIVLFALIIWRSIKQAQVILLNGDVSFELQISLLFLPLFVILGSLSLCLVLLSKMLTSIKEGGLM